MEAESGTAHPLFVRCRQRRYEPATAEQILGAARDVMDQRMRRGMPFAEPTASCRFFQDRLSSYDREVFAAAFLDGRHRLIHYGELFFGTIDGAEVHPREVVRRALLHNAAAVIVAHSVGKVGIVPEDVPPAGPGGWVAGQSATVLRGRGQYGDLRGLGLWLRSQMGKDVLAGVTSGATIPMISIQTLRQLEVPSLSLDATRRAVEVLDREREIQHRIEALKIEQTELSELLWNELMNLKSWN